MTYVVGGTYEARCRPCNHETLWTIVALVDGKISRAFCRSCKRGDGARPPRPSSFDDKPQPPPANEKGLTTQQRKEWCEAVSNKPLNAFANHRNAPEGALVYHDTYGAGLVRQRGKGLEILYWDRVVKVR